jgi:hypothetical protein
MLKLADKINLDSGKYSIVLEAFITLQSIWCAQLIMVLYLISRQHRPVWLLIALSCVSIVYAVSTIGIICKYKIFWVTSIVLLLLYWVSQGGITLISFIYNNYLFWVGHELYQDSPATIIIVWLKGLFMLFIPLFLLVLLILGRKHIIKMLKQPK